MLFLLEINFMSEKVNDLIDGLRSKFNTLHSSIQKEKTEKNELKNQLDKALIELNSKDDEIINLNEKIKQLTNENELMKNEETVSISQEKISEEKINELVNEIDYCIEQLKK